jgi:molybdate transport system substrate-binding protein
MSKLLKPFAALAAATAVVLAGCSNEIELAEGAEEQPADTEQAQELTVFAAASLNAAFSDIATEVFEPENPEVSVKFSFEGSSTLVDQIMNGAPADVFASADQRNMQKAIDADLVEDPINFTDNELTLIVPAGNPANVTGLDDSLSGIQLVVCHPEVPCGNLTKDVFDRAGVDLDPVSEEQKVTDVRGKIESGEGDAGLVYRTDAMAAGDKVEVIPMSVQGTNIYPIAIVKEAKDPGLAQEFIDAVLSDAGQEIMQGYGFSTVSE